MTRIPFQNTCLQPYSNKFKIAVIITILTVVMVVVPYVYSSIVKQKTEVLNVSTICDVTCQNRANTINVSTCKIGC